MTPTEFHSLRRFADTPSGRIAYIEQGSGPVVLFVHGVPLNGYHWRHLIAALHDMRRCIAIDLMSLGYTEIAPSQPVSFTAQAVMLAQFLDALGIDKVDLVANDSGGAIAQIFAVRNPHRLRTLTLTNCDAHDNWPPAMTLPMVEAARRGALLASYEELIEDRATRHARLARAFADPQVLTDEVYRCYIEPLGATPQRRADFHRYWTSFDNQQTVAIEPLLRTLQVPTLIVWGLDDAFFPVRWAHWLHDAIPGAISIVEVPDAKLFFAEDRPAALITPLRKFVETRSGQA
jgi:pimeloyl-ACP methyl ester carboxylesterase